MFLVTLLYIVGIFRGESNKTVQWYQFNFIGATGTSVIGCRAETRVIP